MNKSQTKIKLLLVSLCIILLAFFITGLIVSQNLHKNISINFKENPKENAAIKELVFITGAINNPGVYEFTDGERVVDILNKAGGFSENADSNKVNLELNLAEKLTDGMKIYVPEIIDTTNSIIETQTYLTNKVNINTASLEELDSLPGIGESTAQKIINARPFDDIEDLNEISGIGEAKMEELRDLVTVE